MVFRAVWPPGLVALSLAPVLAARGADAPIPPWAAALNVALPVLILVVGVTVWLGNRKAPIL